MKAGDKQNIHGLRCTQATECSIGNLTFGGVGLSQPTWWDANFMCYQFMDPQSLGYREVISLETLMGAACDRLDFLYWLKQNVGVPGWLSP